MFLPPSFFFSVVLLHQWLLHADGHTLVASEAAKRLQSMLAAAAGRSNAASGQHIASWSLMRSGCVSTNESIARGIQPAVLGPCGWYWQGASEAAVQPQDALLALDVLFRSVGVLGMFSDFPAAVSAYVNCAREV